MERWIDESLHDGWGIRLKADKVLFEEQTAHQHLIIFENQAFGRVMMLDNAVQLTTSDEFIYHEMMAHVPLLALNEPRDVLIIGGGDGGVMREVLQHAIVERVTLCEIDQTVVDMALRYFPEISSGAFENRRANVVIGDGTRYVKETGDQFDVILIDSTDPVGPSMALFAREFYGDCKARLKPGGVLVTQNGVPFVQGEELTNSILSFRKLGFDDVWAYLATTPTYAGGAMAYGWATLDRSLRTQPLDVLEQRFNRANLAVKYYTPEVHQASFALPGYVARLMNS